MLFSPYDHLITHKGCMDGALSAVVFRRFNGNPDHIHFSNPAHDQVDPLAMKVRQQATGKLYLVDISVSQSMAYWLSTFDDVVLYDHHKSAIPLVGYGFCHVDVNNTMCGSKLFYKACQKQLFTPDLTLDNLIDAVDDRDRWVNQNPHSADLSELFSLLGQDAFIERCVKSPYAWLFEDEQVAVSYEKHRRNTYIERLKPSIREVGQHKIGFVCCEPRYVSDAGHLLCEQHDLACCVLISPDTVSLRAPNNSPLDMSAIAKHYGGGGHQGAAGFSIKALTQHTLLEQVVSKFALP